MFFELNLQAANDAQETCETAPIVPLLTGKTMELNPDEARLLVQELLDSEVSENADSAHRDDADHQAQLATGTFGHYRLIRLVGSGGMGEVYEAEQEHPRRLVALKVVRADILSPEAAARFEHEARVLGRLQHPGIARIYEAGRCMSHGVAMPYFAMEFVEGRPLLDYVRQDHLSVPDRLELFLLICEAIEHAHRMGVIHRDLKPGNVLVDTKGQPRVLDFGVARVTDSDVQATTFLTDVGRLVGTLAYMSPEQINGDSSGLDTRSDVYAMGVLLYELLSGRPPYRVERSQLHEAARVITQTTPAPLSQTDRDLAGDLQTIVGKSLEKERDRRYQSVEALAADIRRYLRDEPIEARPANAVYQLRKFARRNRIVVAAAAVASLSMLAGGLAAGWFAWKQWRAVGQLTIARAAEAKQRAEADAKRLEAVRSSEIAWQVVRFVNSTISASSPYRSVSEYTLRDFLENAARELDDSKIDDPLAEAAIRLSVCSMQVALGRFQEALQQSERAVALRRSVLGDEDALTLQAMQVFGHAMLLSGDTATALDTQTRTLATALDRLGPDHETVLSLETSRSQALARLGRLDEAEAIERNALDRARRALGPGHEVTRTLANNLAGIYMQLGRRSEAREIWTSVLNAERAQFGEDSLHTVGTRNNIVVLDLAARSYEQAEAELRSLLPVVEKYAGVNSTLFATSTYNLAVALAKQERWSEAEPVARDALQHTEAVHGLNHPDSLMSRGLLSEILAGLGHYDEAIAMATDTKTGFEKVLGLDHPVTLMSMLKLARMYGAADDAPAAETLLFERRTRALDRYGANHFVSMRANLDIGKFMAERDRRADANPFFAEALTAARSLDGLDPRELVDIRVSYARNLVAVRDFEVAESVLLEENPSVLASAVPSLQRRVLEALVDLYVAWEKPIEAAETRSRLERIDDSAASTEVR